MTFPAIFGSVSSSPHPKDFDDDAVLAMAQCRKVTPYLNLPVQSGDNRVLKAMKRPYTAAQYKTLVKKIRAAFEKYRQGLEKEVAISTDVIVGFCGETENQLKYTAKLFREIKYEYGLYFPLFPTAGTAAALLDDNVSDREKKRREEAINDIVKITALNHNKKYIGKTVAVLVEAVKNKTFALGKTRHYKTVKFRIGKNDIKPGDIVNAKIIKAQSFGLTGALVKNENKLIVIVGPNASGKSEIAVMIAKKFNGEVISADSRQVYKGMDIGSGKIKKSEMKGVPHHLLDVASPKSVFTVTRYRQLALEAIEKSGRPENPDFVRRHRFLHSGGD